ncbi:MAG: alpha/beta fold hydrolase [Bacteroidota bacterium]
MPIIDSKYVERPWYFPSGHFETVVPSLFYEVKGVQFDRERLELPDGDFLDLDWVRRNEKRVVVITHGLEGSSDRHYVLRQVLVFQEKGWDVLAWNNRSCSGDLNRLPKFYHHGATEDLSAVIDHAFAQGYEEMVLIGFSMGGGMQQKYLGEREPDLRIRGAISFSVPCNVLDSADMLSKKGNRFYERKFIKKLKHKILEKAKILELPVNLEEIKKVQTFRDLDNAFTIKVYPEYHDAEDFYQKITSDQFLPNIKIPLLIVNAQNDPMLGKKCYPIELAKQMDNLYLEMPELGGHVGFTISADKSYMEVAAAWFVDNVIYQNGNISSS